MRVIGCGAIARELMTVVAANGLDALEVECLPARFHTTPDEIPAAVEQRIEQARRDGVDVYVAYADCGTGGRLDTVLERHGVERLPGAHCYEFFMGGSEFAIAHEENPATFYLTDYLARHFDRLVWKGLGLDRHPELLDAYFGNYERLLYISQSDDEALVGRARRCAAALGLRFEHRHVGLGDLPGSLVRLAGASV